MIIKGLIDEDFVNYKKPSMFIAFPTCSFKCDTENGGTICQNCALIQEKDIEISKEDLCVRYLSNPLTNAIVFGGLEPFDSKMTILPFVDCLRREYGCNDDIVIYTGYTLEELRAGVRFPNGEPNSILATEWESLIKYPNIIIKYGRFISNQESHLDKILGVRLASPNQYAIIYNEVRNEN